MQVIDGTKEGNVHFKWHPDNSPIATVKPGEEFRVIIPDSSTMQIQENYTTDDMAGIDGSKLDGATGPVYIEGAEPGDAIEVEIRNISTGNWGWTAIMKDFGLLKFRFSEELFIWDIKDGFATVRGNSLKGVKIPVRPFLGVVGTSPSKDEYGMIPPQSFGGNMDNKLLKKGARLILPVNVKGALLSFADPHASQGDGEVCGTAIETSAHVDVVVSLKKNFPLKYPRLLSSVEESGKQMVSMGIGPDLYSAAQEAVLDMIQVLMEKGFTENEAFALCSVAGNLRISEIVDEPNFVVSLLLDEEFTRSR